jgi:hypothetical protein
MAQGRAFVSGWLARSPHGFLSCCSRNNNCMWLRTARPRMRRPVDGSESVPGPIARQHRMCATGRQCGRKRVQEARLQETPFPARGFLYSKTCFAVVVWHVMRMAAGWSGAPRGGHLAFGREGKVRSAGRAVLGRGLRVRRRICRWSPATVSFSSPTRFG